MPKRIIVDVADCSVCRALAKVLGGDLVGLFFEGYVSGMRDITDGEAANIPLCHGHHAQLVRRVVQHIGNGIRPKSG